MNPSQPLAARMRPTHIEQYIGQPHLLDPGKPLAQALQQGRLHSMILWGPPGTGKTTLAHLLAQAADARVHELSAVLAGVKDIRAAVAEAKAAKTGGQSTIVFVDEVHRFNKAQQDAFLPHVEAGEITLIGATTENPAFELNNALLSRVKVYVLKSLSQAHITQVIEQALRQPQGYGSVAVHLPQEVKQALARWADGDARQALNTLELMVDCAEVDDQGRRELTLDLMQQVLSPGIRRFDKGGDIFYDQISALHKSVRGSSPDAALYWLCRMLDGGCDPLYIARRVVRMASEDIGNADPRGLSIALNAWDVQQRLGSPEGELAIAQAVMYLACAAKSNAVYSAFKQCMQYVKQDGQREVPEHLRNAPTGLAKRLGHGQHYRYAHDEPEGYAAGEQYFPDHMTPPTFYQPTKRGLERKIAEKLAYLRQLDQQAQRQEGR